MIEIKSFNENDWVIKTEARGDFTSFPLELYKGDPYYLHNPKVKTPNMESKYFIAYDGKSIVGRITGIINPQLKYEEFSTGLIGFFECIDDIEASKRLFESAFKWLKSQGCDFCIGPMNGSSWNKYRIAQPDGSPNFFLDTYNKHWYSLQFEQSGFEPIATYNSSIVSQTNASEERVAKFEKLFKSKGIVTRNINMDNFEDEIERIYEVCLASFKDNFLYTPIPKDEFVGMYLEAKQFTDPRLVYICEKQDTPLAFAFALNDLYEKNKKRIIIKTVAAKPIQAARGLGAFLTEKIHSESFNSGVDEIIHALMHENNMSNQIMSKNSKIFRKYKLFGRVI